MTDLLAPAFRRDRGGFEAGRFLPFARRGMVGPIVFFGNMAPREMIADLPHDIDGRPHPHIKMAKADCSAGRMKPPDFDDTEYLALAGSQP